MPDVKLGKPKYKVVNVVNLSKVFLVPMNYKLDCFQLKEICDSKVEEFSNL